MIRFMGIIAILSVIYSIYDIASSEKEKDRLQSSAETSVEAKPTAPVVPTAPLSTAKRPRVLLFTGPQWCPPCRDLENRVIASVAWRELTQGEISFQKVIVPRDSSLMRQTDNELLIKHAVRGYPTMVVLDPTGKRELGRRVGSAESPASVTGWVRSLASTL